MYYELRIAVGSISFPADQRMLSRISKCKCGPEEFPVFPLNPIACPLITLGLFAEHSLSL